MKKTNCFFVTITFPDKLYQQNVEDSFKKYIDKNCSEFYVVKEFGSSGDNPHIHAYLLFTSDKRSDNITRSIRSFYVNTLATNKSTIRTVKCLSKVDKVGGYMQKEKNKVELFVRNIDVTQCITVYDQQQRLAKKLINKVETIPYAKLPQYYIDYCKRFGYESSDINLNLARMFKEGLYPYTYFPKLKYTKRAIELLLLKQDDIQSMVDLIEDMTTM